MTGLVRFRPGRPVTGRHNDHAPSRRCSRRGPATAAAPGSADVDQGTEAGLCGTPPPTRVRPTRRRPPSRRSAGARPDRPTTQLTADTRRLTPPTWAEPSPPHRRGAWPVSDPSSRPLRRRHPARPRPHRHPVGLFPQLPPPPRALGSPSATPAPHPASPARRRSHHGHPRAHNPHHHPGDTRPLARQATFLRSEGSGPSGPRHPRAATFRCTVSLRDTHPVIIRQVRAGLAELSTHATSALPLTVKGGTPKPLTVRISVHKCAALPPGLTLPHLDLGLRSRQAQQQHSYLFGGACPRDLATSPHAACGPHQGGMGRPADRERISHGSNNQLPLPQQSNAEREPPLPEAPGIGLPDGTLPPVRIKITPSSVAEQHVLYMRAPTPSGQKSQSPPLHPPTSTAS